MTIIEEITKIPGACTISIGINEIINLNYDI